MAIIYLYDKTATDFTYNGQPLPEAYQAHVDYVMNDEFFITFQYPLDKKKRYKEIEKHKIITAHTPDGKQPFRIMDTRKKMNSIEVEAWPLFYADMRNKMIRPLSLKNATGHTAFNQFTSQLLLETPFEITTNITAKHDYNTQDITEKENNPNQLYDALEVLKALVIRWNGEVIINGYDIRILNRIGDNKEALLYEKKNIANFVDEESIVNIVTRVHGKSEWTEINDKNEEIEHSIKATVDSPLINAYSGIIFEKQFTNNNIRSKQSLENWLKLKFSTDNIDKPRRNIEVGTNVVDGQEISVGDGLVLKYLLHDVDMQIRMVGYRYDGFDNRYIAIHLGDAKQSLVGNFQNSISEVENNISKIDKIVADVIINSLGEKMIYSETEPKGNFKKGDTWFDAEGGMWFWDEEKADWIPHPYNRRTDIAEQLIKEAQKEIADTKENIDNRLEDLDIELTGKFTDIDEELLTIEEISNKAEESAQIAIGHGLDALEKAGQIEGDVSNISFEVDRIGGQLDLKADRAVVDEISEVVDMHELGIKANADGLALKANKDTVDRLEGTVSSLGTDVDVIAGEISNKVWKTDIESAVDELSYENRNLFAKSKAELGYLTGVGESVISSHPKGEMTSEYIKIEGTEDLYLSYYFSPTPDYKWIAWTFYDENKENINGRPGRHIRDTEDSYDIWYRHLSVPEGAKYFRVSARWLENGECKLKLEKGTKATDYSLAPEDTDAKIDYIETEFNQTFEKFDQRVVNLDGQLSLQSQEIGRITQTIQDVSESVEGNTTKINQTINTVDSHSQTIATIETDLDGKVEVSDYNTLVNTVDSTIRRIGDAEGNITQIEASINGLQTTVAGKVSLTQFSQLETGFKLFASNINTVNKNLADKWFYQRINDDGSSTQVNTSKAIPFTKLPDNTTHLTVEDGSWGGWYNSAFFWYKENSDSGYLGKYDLRINEDNGENIVTVEIPPNAKYFRYHTTPNMSRETKIEVGTEATGLFYNDSEIRSEISVVQEGINLKVEKGDVIGQINIEAGTTLIENDKLYLDARTVVFSGKAFIPGAVIKDLSADKLTAGIIDGNHIRVINLDAGHIVTGTLTGIRVEADEGFIGGWTMEKGGLYKDTPYGYTVLKPDGDVAIATSSPQHSHAGGAVFQLYHNGRMSFLNDEGRYSYIRADNSDRSSGTKGLVISSQGYIYMSPGATVEVEGRITPDVNKERTLGSEEKFWSSVFGYTFRINNGGAVQQGAAASDGGNSLEVYSRGSLMLKSENRAIYSQGGLYPYYSSNTYYLGSAGYRWQGAFLSSQPNVSSDMRDKKLIQDIPQGLIEQMKNVKGKWYQQDGKWHLGYIAQDVERAIYKYVSSIKKWDSMEAMNEYARSFAMLHKDESKLSLLYGEIAVIKEAEMQARMDRLENKLEELLDAS